MNTPSRDTELMRERDRFIRAIAPDSHFHRILDTIPDVYFFVKNRLGQTLFCSANLPFNHGLRNEWDMLGKTDHELTPGPLAEKYLSDDAEIYRTGEPLLSQIEICIDHVGLPNWYRTSKFPVKDRAGKMIGIMGIFRLVSITETGRLDPLRIEPARLMLQSQLTEMPTIESLATSCKLSVRHFQRSFRLAYGHSPQTYWMKLRIRRASELIRSKQFTLSQIAHDLGFCDQSSFTKHFRKHTGQTPHAFANYKAIASAIK